MTDRELLRRAMPLLNFALDIPAKERDAQQLMNDIRAHLNAAPQVSGQEIAPAIGGEPASAAPDGMPKPIPFAFVIGENDDANCYGFIACNIHKGNEFQVPVYSKTTVDALLARIEQLEKDRALSLPDCVSVPVGPTDTELLNWAERHPEQSMSEIRSWWTTCGRGSREISFNFRGVIRGAMLAARWRNP